STKGRVMKTTHLKLIPVLGLGLLAGCQTPEDRELARDTGVGAATGAAIGGVIGNQSDETAEGAAIGAAVGAAAGAGYNELRERYYDDEIDFDSLDDYDEVLTSNERDRLRDRAIEAGDDPDDYLDYLTTEEKERL